MDNAVFQNEPKRTTESVFIGLQEVAGFYTGMYLGLKALGVNCELAVTRPYAYGPVPGGESVTVRVASSLQSIETKAPRFVKRYLIPGLRVVVHAWLMVWSLPKFSNYLFAFGKSFLPGNVDLLLLKALKKTTIVMLGHGSEARPPFMSAKFLADDGRFLPPAALSRLNSQKAKRLKFIEKHASAVVCSPQTGHFLTQPFVKYSSLGRPTVIPTDEVVARSAPTGTGSKVRILHAPSHRLGKGSECIREIAEQLSSEGFDIEYEEVSGVSNQVVLAKIAQCDIVVDQVYSDIPLSKLGTEAGLFSKPCLVGGYGWSQMWDKMDSEEIPPAVHVTPDAILSTLRHLVEDQQYRIAAGERLHQFVVRRWNAEIVAHRLLRIFSGGAPQEWFFSPSLISYMHGWGLPESRAKESVGRLLEFGGGTVLSIPDKPRLVSAFTTWARQ